MTIIPSPAIMSDAVKSSGNKAFQVLESTFMFIFPPQRKKLVRKRVIASTIIGIFIIYSLRRSKREIKMRKASSEMALKLSRRLLLTSGDERVTLNSRFLKRLWFILKILMPHWRSHETGLVALHTAFLIVRTALSVSLAALDGILMRALVTKDRKGFLRGLFLWFAIAAPATYTNSMIKFTQSKMAMAFRTRLTKYIQSAYLKDNAFYKMLQLDRRMDHPNVLPQMSPGSVTLSLDCTRIVLSPRLT
jgi:ABC-type uncharacterized transport system fused permease/ATPase subunit